MTTALVRHEPVLRTVRDNPRLPSAVGAIQRSRRATEAGRTLATSVLVNVMPTKPHHKNRLVVSAETRLPEPAALYALIVLALAIHQPAAGSDTCGECAEAWPCPQVRLAFRLREAF